MIEGTCHDKIAKELKSVYGVYVQCGNCKYNQFIKYINNIVALHETRRRAKWYVVRYFKKCVVEIHFNLLCVKLKLEGSGVNLDFCQVRLTLTLLPVNFHMLLVYWTLKRLYIQYIVSCTFHVFFISLLSNANLVIDLSEKLWDRNGNLTLKCWRRRKKMCEISSQNG